MSSTPTAFPVLDAYLTWFKAHEKLLLFVIGALTLTHYVTRGLDSWDRHEALVAKEAATVVKVDDAATKVLQQQLTDLRAQVDSQNALLGRQIAQRVVVTQAQQKTDATLPPNDLAARWALLSKTDPNTIHPIAGEKAFRVEDTTAVVTVQQLEVIPELEATNVALETELTNEQMLVSKQVDMIAQLNKDLVDERKSHVADVNLEKAKAKRSFVRGLKYGFIAGFAAGAYIAHAVF